VKRDRNPSLSGVVSMGFEADCLPDGAHTTSGIGILA